MAALPLDRTKGHQVQGVARRVTVQITRPSNTTAYADGDQIDSTGASTGLTFANVVPEAEQVDNRTGATCNLSGVIAAAQIVSSAYVATALQCELWLFDTMPTLSADNAPVTFTDAQLQGGHLIGIIAFGATAAHPGIPTAGADGNQVLTSGQICLPFQCAAGSTSLFGVLVAKNAYVPVSAEKLDVTLSILN